MVPSVVPFPDPVDDADTPAESGRVRERAAGARCCSPLTTPARMASPRGKSALRESAGLCGWGGRPPGVRGRTWPIVGAGGLGLPGAPRAPQRLQKWGALASSAGQPSGSRIRPRTIAEIPQHANFEGSGPATACAMTRVMARPDLSIISGQAGDHRRL